MRVLVVNAGSSSLKLSMLDGDDLVDEASLPAVTADLDDDGLRRFVDRAGDIDAVGHRIVHGGTEFAAATIVDDEVKGRIAALSDLAPLHQPPSLAALDAVGALRPDLTAVACFDTAFHATIPAAAATYALPEEWRRRWPLRRFGFHGLSHAYVAQRAPQLLGRPAQDLRIVSCHLGAGASVTAIRHGLSVDTTMGFTPLEGLVMATRSGSVDPGLVLWLQEHGGIPAAELGSALEHRSGLVGLAGTADLRVVLEAEAAGHEQSALAVEIYLHRLRAGVAAMAAAMDGLDVLVFTGGVGENSADIRLRAAAGLGFLGISVEPTGNENARPDARIASDTRIDSPGAEVVCLVVKAREDLQIARSVASLMA